MNSTNTSSISSISTNYRQKGKLPSNNSKIYKGFMHEASSKLSVGSIPAKFETIVVRNQSQKAFGSSETRFTPYQTEVPGPQEYDCDHLYSIAMGKGEESQSKKGSGGFASSEQRSVFQQKYTNSGPGPGTYQEASFFNQSIFSESSRNNTVSKLSSTFKKSSSVGKIKSSSSEEPRVKIIQPGPGEYDAEKPRTLNTYNSAFISQSKRDEYMKRPEFPAPGQYNIKRSILKKNPTNIGPSSSFYPQIDHRKEQTTQQRLMNFLDDPQEKADREQSPGPCDYDAKLPHFEPEYADTQVMSSFKQQSKNRFGDPNDKSKIKQDLMGPGMYEIKGQLETIAEEKTLVSGSAFMSECLRKPFGEFETRLGPNTNIPYILPKKKNYHLNLQKKWV